jgi:hypothetical protein
LPRRRGARLAPIAFLRKACASPKHLDFLELLLAWDLLILGGEGSPDLVTEEIEHVFSRFGSFGLPRSVLCIYWLRC